MSPAAPMSPAVRMSPGARMQVDVLARTSALGPSTRYRFEQYRERLAAEGIEMRLRPLFGARWFAILAMPAGPLRLLAKLGYCSLRLFARLGQIVATRCGQADLVVVEQQLFPYLPGWVEALLWPRRQPTALEFDDAIYLTAGHRGKLERLCARADLVIVGNRFLEAFAEPHARRVVVIPTTVDVARYTSDANAAGDAAEDSERATETGAADVLRLAWIGLPYNLAYLQALAAPLKSLAAEGVPCELVVISSAAPDPAAFAPVPVVHRPWSADSEAAELRRCDIGIMPLPDSEWARGKCGLKLLQSMAAGLAVVASPVGVNNDIVEDGRNGLLAGDPEAWAEAFRRLARDPELRGRLAATGRATVADRYSVERGARLVAETYRQACRTPEVPGPS